MHPAPGALYGVFCVVNYWLPTPDGSREILQAKNVINAAKRASVRHFIYSSIAGAASDNGPPWLAPIDPHLRARAPKPCVPW